MNVYKLRVIFLQTFRMYRIRKIVLNIFSYALLITAGTKIIFPKLFEIEWFLFIFYAIFFFLFVYSNYYIAKHKRIISAWYLLLVEKHKGPAYRKNPVWNRLVKLLINLNQYDNFRMYRHYQANEQNLSRAFETIIIFAFFVIFIKVPAVEWLFWALALIVEIYFKIILHKNSKAHYIIKWMLLSSTHLLFFDKSETDTKTSNLIVNSLIKKSKINRIIKSIAERYRLPNQEIIDKLLLNHKTSHHFKNTPKTDHNLNASKVSELLNYDNKKLYKEFINDQKFFKLISHKINY